MAQIVWIDEDLDDELSEILRKLKKQKHGNENILVDKIFNFNSAVKFIETDLVNTDLYIVDILLPESDTGIVRLQKYGYKIIDILIQKKVPKTKIIIFSNENRSNLTDTFVDIDYFFKQDFVLNSFVSKVLDKLKEI